MRNLSDEEKKKIEDALGRRGTWYTNPMNISPTDKDAKGMYPYQEPEIDEQGTYYGYKVLIWEDGRFRSPRYPVRWTLDGQLHADRKPSEKTMSGIHFTKRPDHPELKNYMGGVNIYSAVWERTGEKFLVKCALSGNVIIETEQGFRAEHAQIIGVLINGNWTSYQDYYERAFRDTNPITESQKEREYYWRLSYGKPTKRTNTYYAPDADS